MGIELVKLVSRRYGNLDPKPYKVLVAMAVTALDRPNDHGDPPRLYFGGWEPLALALGYTADDLAAERGRKKVKEQVRRAVKPLTDARIVTPLVGHARIGERQVWRLDLDPGQGPRDGGPPSRRDTETGAQRDTETGAQEGHRDGSQRDTATGAPRKTEEQRSGQTRGPTIAPDLASSAAASDDAAAPGLAIRCALLDACDVHEPLTPRYRSALDRAINELRQTGATPDEIARRARIHRDTRPDQLMTPSDLARHWHEVADY